VLSRGRRAKSRNLAVHVLRADPADPGPAGPAVATRPARAGLVVSGKVGNSVVRHRVSRRLRAQLRPLLAELPAGTDVVVRAFPSTADADSTVLAADLGSALRSALQRGSRR
jgi:ribonuclease P protein component